MEKKSTNLKNIFSKIIHPTSFGIILTLWLVYTAFTHYTTKHNKTYEPPVTIQVLRKVHQLSIDWRLNSRGQRSGSPRVVVLTVDEKALEQEGKWPWNRTKIKRIIETLIDAGATVIGFDMVFSEPDNVNAIDSLNLIKKNSKDSPKILKIVQQEYQKAQTDKQLGKTIAKYGDHLVLGSYFEAPLINSVPKGFQNLCLEKIFARTSDAEVWDNQEPIVIPIDQTGFDVPNELPDSMSEILEKKLNSLAIETTKSSLISLNKTQASQLSKTAQIELNSTINEMQWRYCLRWLSPPPTNNQSIGTDVNKIKFDEDFFSYKKNWPSIVEEDETLEGLSFSDGMTLFRERQFNTNLEMNGRWWLNTPKISNNTKHLSYFNAVLDKDGTIRTSPLVVHIGNRFFPSLALRTFLVANKYMAQLTLDKDIDNLGYKAISELAITDLEGEKVGEIPVDPLGFLRINYAGSQKMFAHLSVADVLNNDESLKVEIQQEKNNSWETITKSYKKTSFYKDKIFVFGATAVGIYDLRVTPFEENFPGVETHANIIDNMERGDYLVDLPGEELKMLFLLLCLGIFFSLLLSRIGALQGIFLTLTALLSIYFIDKYFLFNKGYVVHIVFPLVLISSLYLVLTAYKYFTEEKNKKELKGTFGKYVSPAIVDEILAAPGNIELGGKKEHISVFFSDIRGFTTISERLDATSLSDLLNSYLTPMTEIIFNNKGTLDKYMGDAIMAFFGAPISHSNHAEQACRAALENIDRLKLLQKDYKEKGLPNIDVGIGINTGEMSVGNMGSEIVRNYTVMGDAVNLGARLEGINKQYGTRIIISEFTYKEVKEKFITRQLDLVKVKGKELPVRIYELISETPVSQGMQNMIDFSEKGFCAYQEKKWDDSINAFTNALNFNPSDAVSKLYLERCHEFQKNPPSENWDGVFTMMTK